MRARSIAILIVLPLLAAAGCNKESLGFRAMSIMGKGVVNDPKNKSLRFDLLKFGLDEFCKEMRLRGTPLKLRDGEPVVGRFYADGCSSQIIDDADRQSFVVQYSGQGYGWTNVTERLGFKSTGLIEYGPDFRLHDKAMYIYFRPRNVSASSFQTAMVESQLAQQGIAVTGVSADQIGQNILDSQLQRGFTVIRYSSRGETEFGMGYIPVGQRPFRPFQVVHSDKLTLDNDRTEVHSGQQDYIGGFVVEDDDQSLFLTMKVDGAPSIDVLVIGKTAGDQLLQGYVARAGAVPLNAPPLFQHVVPSGERWTGSVAVPKGLYYLMLDHSTVAGQTAPPAVAGDNRAAKVDYLVQVADSD